MNSAELMFTPQNEKSIDGECSAPDSKHQSNGNRKIPSRRPDDPLQDYLDQIARNPLLTAEQEIEIGLKIASARKALRTGLLGCAFVVEHAIAQMKEVVSGGKHVMEVCQVAGNNHEKVSRLVSILPNHLELIEVLLQNNRDAFRRFLGAQASSEEQSNAWKKLSRDRAKIVRLMDELCFRTSCIEPLMQEVEEKNARVQACLLSSSSAPSDCNGQQEPAVRNGKLDLILTDVLDTPEGLSARVQDIKTAYAEFHRAVDELVLGNLLLVVSIAKKFGLRGHALLDVVADIGNSKLRKAAMLYDPKRGNRFSTYAVWGIQRDVARAQMRRRRNMSVSNTLDTPVAGARGSRADRIPDHREVTQGEDMDMPWLQAHVAARLKELPPKVQTIIRMRFGFDGGPEMQPVEIAEALDISREGVRQAIGNGLSALGGLIRRETCAALFPDQDSDLHVCVTKKSASPRVVATMLCIDYTTVLKWMHPDKRNIQMHLMSNADGSISFSVLAQYLQKRLRSAQGKTALEWRDHLLIIETQLQRLSAQSNGNGTSHQKAQGNGYHHCSLGADNRSLQWSDGTPIVPTISS